MSKNVKVKLSYSGIGALMRGPEMAALMEQYGSAAAARAGDGYGYRVHNTGQRQACNVFPETKQASRNNLKNNTLLKSVK